jgi:diadenylate cyclase
MPKKNELNDLITKTSKQKKTKEKDLTNILKMFAPGTVIRTAIDDLLRARMGALILIEKEGIDNIIEKGFRINSKFSAQRLVELAKMDGAIILSSDAKKILYANSLLVPSVSISTKETGTRHKAAERTAKQLNTIVIAISERKNKISLYYGNLKHELEQSAEILRRAAETLQILEKQREMFNDLLKNFNVLEINGLVTIDDVSTILQRLETINRISNIVKKYLIGLGKEGMIVSMRLKELTSTLDKKQSLILKDYFEENAQSRQIILERMNFDSLLEKDYISKALFDEIHDKPISSTGLRILKKTNALDQYLDLLITKHQNLETIMTLSDEELLEIFKTEDLVKYFKEELNMLKEKVMIGKDL